MREILDEALSLLERGDGFSAADMGRVFSPIGIAIAAETPAELAVSVTAELIRERAAMMG